MNDEGITLSLFSGILKEVREHGETDICEIRRA